MDAKSDTFAPLRNVFNKNAAIHAPFDGLDEMQIERKVTEFIQHTRLDDYKHYFMKAAFLAQSDEAFNGNHGDGPLGLFLSDEEEFCLLEEKTNRWKQPRALWQLVALCAIGAITQGWDEAAVDGGTRF
jgi:hypothetical protein